MQYKRKRLNLNVKRQFQMWLLVRIFGTVMLSSIVAAAILYFYARHETTASFYEAHIKIRHVSDLLLPVIAAGSLVSLLGGTVLALFLPQKIAGPVYRIEEHLKAVRAGDLTLTLRLRRKDVLQELAESINETLGSLRTTLQAVKEAEAQLDSALAADNQDQITAALNQQKEVLNRLQI